MNLSEAIILFGIMVALAALPSSSVALVVARAATSDITNGIAAAVGIVLGDLVFVALAILGLSVVAETLGSFFALVKILGGLYLIYLGIKLLKSKPGSVQAPINAKRTRGLAASLIAGFVLTLGDLKAILFYASLLPMFINLSAINAHEVMAIVAITIIAVGSVKISYAIFGVRVASFASRQKYAGACQKTAGGLLIGTGSYVAFKA
ncbi:MAG: threonine transporter [Salinisphaeraceae bacterium]|nr:threonine transporter [Salinisphaeraceae bacterium]